MDYLQKIIKLFKSTIIFILVEQNRLVYLVVALWLLVSTLCVCANKPCFVCLLNIPPFRQNIFHSKFSSSELVMHISSFVYTVEFCYGLMMEFFCYEQWRFVGTSMKQ
jgi:hypothetical protein